MPENPLPNPARPVLQTADAEHALHEYNLHLAGRAWKILHTEVVLTTEDESRFFRERMQQIPYGVALWPSSIALAHELASRPNELATASVLELGAGTGLPGIVAASFGAKVVQTDREPLALSVCERNARLNGVNGIEHRKVDWTDWQDTAHYDFIIGSDILYGEPMHAYLRTIFETNLKPGGRVLLTDPFRGISIRLFETLATQGWNIAVAKWRLGEADGQRAVGLFELNRATSDIQS